MENSSSQPHQGPTLPPDFPKHLLLRICDAILAPLLNHALPLKPYSRPWTRNQPSPWHVAHSPELAIEASESKAIPSPNWARVTRIASSAKGSAILNCKSDCISFASCNQRMWAICQDMVHRHIRVSSLAIADILVSRRNILRHTRVFEIYITREVEASQAQSDLNLSRFFIQAGILLLWSPLIHTVIIDLKAVPPDPHIWASFISRLRQRLFIMHIPVASLSSTSPPMIQETPETNIVPGAGKEKSTSWDMTARWGDSQGLINSPEKVSIPHLALSLGYTAAGDVNDGLGGMLDALFSSPLPRNAESLNISGMLSSNPTVAPSRLARTFDTLTALDLSIPRPTWGHEESEGHALGLKLRRLAALKRLSLHADGGIQNNSSNAEFGLMRQPPFGITGIDVETDDEADMSINADGTVLYPAKSNFQGSHFPPSSTNRVNSNPRGGVVGNYSGGFGDGGYGPETWWAGIFDALSLSAEEDTLTSSLPPQSIEELRISVSVPGGHVELGHFDAFYATVVSYFRRMTTLQDLIFDMSFSTPQEEPFLSRTRNDSHMFSNFERQKYYVEWLTDPHISQIPLVAFKPELVSRQSEPRNFLSSTTPHTAHFTTHTVSYDSHSSRPDSGLELKEAEVSRSASRVSYRKESEEGKVSTPNLRHVYFGEYHGLPMMPPSDWEYDQPSISSQKVSLPAEETGKPSGSSPPAEKEYTGAKAKRAKGIDGTDPRMDGAVVVHPGRGVSGSARGNVSDGRTRTLPGMWWTIGSPSISTPRTEGNIPSEGETTRKRVIVQGWKEPYEMDTVTASSWIGERDVGGEQPEL
ncbi:hypothetical protein FRB91_010148 [Serendipita sp. 411]|nr:hypothetical protein FRC18_011438 [Serendipita sp. 400]KAG8849226.1 hypothetical protein FRB91_010148 [Serendipita sp. 411]